MNFQRISQLYKNPKIFLITTFVALTGLFYPISYLPQALFLTSAIILTFLIGTLGYLNQRTGWNLLKGIGPHTPTEYRDMLSVHKHISKVQIIGGIILFVTFGSLLIQNHIESIPSLIKVQIQTISLILFLPSFITTVFSSIHMAGRHPIKRKNELDLSRVWLMSIDENDSKTNKIKRLIKCIENYDEFLDELLKQRIFNLDQIFTKLFLDIPENINKFVKEMKEKYTEDDLSILKHLSEYLEKDKKFSILIKHSKNIKMRSTGSTVTNILITVSSIVALIISIMKDVIPRVGT